MLPEKPQFEKAAGSTGPEKETEEQKFQKVEMLPGTEIPKEEWETLQIIAKRVGGDFGMKVKLGEAGRGSFFDPETASITFDPIHIKEKPELAKLVAGHEGAHRAITPHPKEIGLSQKQIEAFYPQVGFAYLQNIIEDPAVNDWLKKRFPGMEPYVENNYNDLLKTENVLLGPPEIQQIARELGYPPRFAQYGSEIIRDWHQGRFSKELDPAVKKALERTLEDAKKSIAYIPNPEKRDEKEIIATAQERFRINTEHLWPEVKKLVEMDLHTEEQRQMLNEFRQKQRELEQKKDEFKKAKGDPKKQGELQKEIEGLERELDPFNQLPKGVRRELQKQTDRAIQEAARQLQKEIDQAKEQIEQAQKRQTELQKEIDELEEKIEEAASPEKENLEKQLEQKKQEEQYEQAKQKDSGQKLEEIQEALEEAQEPTEAPFPEEALSQKTKRELEKLFNKLPRSKKEQHRQAAERKLEEVEDKINKGMEGKLNQERPASHEERHQQEEQERQTEAERKKKEQENKELEQKLERLRREKMTEYDKAYEEVADIVNSLYIRLKRFFLPERHPKWRKGYPSGSRLNLEQAMQAEADPRQLEKIWERKTVPHKIDYRFSLLVDLSSSMSGKKIEETFKGLVTLVEVLEKLGIHYEVIGFSSEVKVFKDWREKLDNKKRDELSQMKTWSGGSTHTDEATELAREHLEKNQGKNNFIVTLTDGVPEPHKNAYNLKQILRKLQDKNIIKTVGVGLGPGTEFVRDYYPASFSIPNIKPTEAQKREGTKDFAEAFAEILEDMIRHPEKY